jgi:two-component system cell cycle response regulator
MGAHILVVEDNPPNLDLMTYLLEAHGHTVTPATQGQRALELARADPPDLVVMDIQLDDSIDGYEALRRIRQDPRFSGLPVVAVTAFAMLGEYEIAIAAGFTAYLSKPLDPLTFVADIERHLPTEMRGQRRGGSGRGVAEVPTAPRPPKPRQRSPQGPAILVVDDLATNLELMRAILEAHGYQVHTARTVDEAVAAARADRPALVLSDLHIGHDSGTRLLHELRSAPDLADIIVAFTTATAEAHDVADIRDVPIIRRPIEPNDLLGRVTELLPRPTRE